MVEDKRADGQLDECDLTLRDLRAIQEIFTRTLSGTLHARIEYPDDKKHRPIVAPVHNVVLPELSLATFESEAQGAITPFTIVHSSGGEERKSSEKQDGANGSNTGRTRRSSVGTRRDGGTTVADRDR